MTEAFLLNRILLQFSTTDDDMYGELSAAALTPDGSLWTGSDELLTLERLSPVAPYVFGDHRSFALGEFVELFNEDGEIDIEGMDYADGYLWFTGSHSTKRKKTRGKKPAKALERLSNVKTELNRYLLARIPVVGGELVKACPHPDRPDQILKAGWLQKTAQHNILIEVLREDEHLGPFLSFPLPGKENGFDIEGLAVRGNRLFLGFRGPVLGRWAIILEIEIEETETGMLVMKSIGTGGRHYKKHFVELNGLGVRELCLHGDDLLILAGPTMDLEGAMQVFRLKKVLELDEDSISEQDADNLALLFTLPFTVGSDHAEGMALFVSMNQPQGLLVVYDSPDPARKPGPREVFADVFLLR